MDFDSKHRPHLESLLEPGEELLGICAASQQKGLFKGGVVALGVGDRRLIVRGEGRILGELGGGEPQRRGIEALGRWFSSRGESP